MHDIVGYETLAVLGNGQFGTVVLVRRTLDRKLFAAKLPHGGNEAARQAIRHESQLLRHLKHVNVVQYVDLVEDEGQSALVMEYASGGDLDAFLRLQQENTTVLSESAIMRVFIQLVLALRYLHDNRVVHRDLKPKNILLDGDGIVKVSDFGISKALKDSLTSSQTITGTPHYMAPELLDGASYDCKSDVWSLGCVLYELATFSPPFTGSALGAVVGQILHSDPRPISHHFTSPFRSLLTKLLEKDPHRRPGLSDIVSCDAVQYHMMQLVSVATSHQPMLLDQYALKLGNASLHTQQDTLDVASPFELVSSLSSYGHRYTDDNHVVSPPTPIQVEANYARVLFFENQAAARRNKERVDEERSRAAVFLEYSDGDPFICHAQDKASLVSNPTRRQAAVEDRSRAASYSEEAFEDFGCLVARGKHDPLPPAPSSARLQEASFEELLNAERRRVKLETKALQDRMRAMQIADALSFNTTGY